MNSQLTIKLYEIADKYIKNNVISCFSDVKIFVIFCPALQTLILEGWWYVPRHFDGC